MICEMYLNKAVKKPQKLQWLFRAPSVVLDCFQSFSGPSGEATWCCGKREGGMQLEHPLCLYLCQELPHCSSHLSCALAVPIYT